MFSLSGPCELLFLLYFIATWTRVVVSVMLYVSLLMDLFVLCVVCMTVFVNCLVKQFASQYVWACCYFVVECYGSV